MSALLALVALAALAVAPVAPDRITGSKWLEYHNAGPSVEIAKTLLMRDGINATRGDTKNRMCVPLLYSYPFNHDVQGPCLKCAAALFKKNLQSTTPTDFFVFITLAEFANVPKWLLESKNFYLIPLDEETWRMPLAVRPEAKGWSGGFWIEYRLMGHFRLSFAFPFCKLLGYEYLFQMDHDTFVLAPPKVGNLVDFMRKNDVWLTNKDWYFYEQRNFAMGLPELATFWLATRKGNGDITKENQARFDVVGPIFDHTIPPNSTGLHTMTRDAWNQEGRKGWDAQCISGNFNIFSLAWWFKWEIQDFIHLVLRTGAHIEHRWVDVSTQSMIRHLFCHQQHFVEFNITAKHPTHYFPNSHGRGPHCAKCGPWPDHKDIPPMEEEMKTMV